MIKRLLALALLCLATVGCDKADQTSIQANQTAGLCAKDTDCKGDRICESGQCVSPGAQSTLTAKPQSSTDLTPGAPSISYESLQVSDDSAGPFSTAYRGMGAALNYQSRAGVMNLMEAVVEDPELTGYVKIEKAYAFGPSQYVLIVSTGEGGRACPASTYALSFDTKSESVDGITEVEGCSEMVEAISEGNKLTVKKDGAATIIYNGTVK